jgi:type VI secretion system secreted protein Hcp
MARGDMFLKVETARQGTINGESHDAKHKNEIDVLSWSWGMRSRSSMSAAGSSSKAALDELEIVKRVDAASAPLMAAMRNNDVIKKAVLTVRKAGGDPLEYMKITVQNGRLTNLTVNSGETELMEKVTLSYRNIEVVYVPQGADGKPRGSMVFETEIAAED